MAGVTGPSCVKFVKVWNGVNICENVWNLLIFSHFSNFSNICKQFSRFYIFQCMFSKCFVNVKKKNVFALFHILLYQIWTKSTHSFLKYCNKYKISEKYWQKYSYFTELNDILLASATRGTWLTVPIMNKN